jgi:N-acetylglucosamine malate deacetylase 1
MIDRLASADTRVLVLCPHTDDEFGCAGTIRRLVEMGAQLHYVAFSDCVESVPAGYPPDTLRGECRACVRDLGVPDDQVVVHSYPVRNFPALRQELLERLVQLRREVDPHLVLLPSSFDTHQDHHTIYEEGFRAFKHATLLGYEMPQNLISFSNSAFVRLSDEDLEAKVQALGRYASQQFRDYASREFVVSLARVRGMQSGSRYAEAFELIRLIVQ